MLILTSPTVAGESPGGTLEGPIPITLELSGPTDFDFKPFPEDAPSSTSREVDTAAGAPVLRLPEATDEELSFRDLLGVPITRAVITNVRRYWLDRSEFEDPRDLLHSVLDAPVVSQRRFDRPKPHIDWAEMAYPTLEAQLHYAGGAVGRLVTNGAHVRLEDAAGHSWYYRWASDDPLRPRPVAAKIPKP
ncbi:MAG: hypothetical protein AAFX50_23300 [Acidobacteriota bacterium]